MSTKKTFFAELAAYRKAVRNTAFADPLTSPEWKKREMKALKRLALAAGWGVRTLSPRQIDALTYEE
jgi:hypothetical protein